MRTVLSLSTKEFLNFVKTFKLGDRSPLNFEDEPEEDAEAESSGKNGPIHSYGQRFSNELEQRTKAVTHLSIERFCHWISLENFCGSRKVAEDESGFVLSLFKFLIPALHCHRLLIKILGQKMIESVLETEKERDNLLWVLLFLIQAVHRQNLYFRQCCGEAIRGNMETVTAR